jgi:uncharacterized protein YjiS (DUF1127 family)
MKREGRGAEVVLLHLLPRLPAFDEKEIDMQRNVVTTFGDVRARAANDTRFLSAAMLFGFAVVMRNWARSAWSAGKWLDARLERRRLSATALAELKRMSARDLQDIGLNRGDIYRVAGGAWDGYPDRGRCDG